MSSTNSEGTLEDAQKPIQQDPGKPKKNNDTAFFGQPHGLSTLFFTEMWERFSYYGMRAILVFYLYYAVTAGGLGMDQTTALAIMSIYGSLVYLSGVIGGWVSDRLLGSRRTVFWGGLLIMFGHICLSINWPGMSIGAAEGFLYASITLLVIGTGFLKPNVSDMVGGLYAPGDKRRDSGFSLFVFGINLGAAISPILVPWAASGFGIQLFGEAYNFHAGFGLAAIGMAIGLLQYVLGGRKYLSNIGMKPNDPLEKDQLHVIVRRIVIVAVIVAVVMITLAVVGWLNIDRVIDICSIVAIAIPIIYFIVILCSPKVNHEERRRVWAYVPLFIAAAIFWAIEESGSSVLAVFAQTRTILDIGPITLDPANFQTLNPLFIMILTPFFVHLWDTWKNQPTAPSKFATGLIFAGLSYAWMAIPGALWGTDGQVSPLWLVMSWFLCEIAEMLISPIGLSVTTKLAPKAFESQMMSMWFLADSAGQAVNAQIVQFYTPATEVQYFLAIGVVSVIAGIIMFFFVKRIDKLMGGVK